MLALDFSSTAQSVGAAPDGVSPWGTPSQRVAQKRNKRDALLSTAARLFKQQGFANASLDQVAAQLGITKPTLYYYVRSKSELIQACALQGWSNASSAVQAALQSTQTPPLATALTAYATVLHSDFGWCMVRVAEYAQSTAMDKAVRQQRKALEQCMGEALVASPLPIALMLRALEGVVLASSRSQWIQLVESWVAMAKPVTGSALDGMAVAIDGLSAIHAEAEPLHAAVERALNDALPLEALPLTRMLAQPEPEPEIPIQFEDSIQSKNLLNQILADDISDDKKATKKSVKIIKKAVIAAEQISLF